MKSNLIPGDRIKLLDMVDEYNMSPGVVGTVTRIVDDPFEPGSEIISVEWDDGSSLALLSSVDRWKKVNKDSIKESSFAEDPHSSWMMENKDIKKYFDYKKLKQFLDLVRDSGIINMYGAAPLIYAGQDHIERYYGEGKEDDEDFQKMIEMADDAKYTFINGLVKYAEAKGKDLDDMGEINRLAKKIAPKIFQYYMLFH